MSAILGILKVIGILLLILLGILLLLIIILLFCPIHYRIAGAKNEIAQDDEPASAEPFWFNASIRWLCGLVRIKYVYPKPGALLVKLLCFTLYDSSKASKNPPEQAPPKMPVETTNTSAEKVFSDSKTPSGDTLITDKASNPINSQTKADTIAENKGETKKNKQSLPEKLKFLYQEFCFYKDFWNAQATQKLLHKLFYRCKKIILSILPHKLDAQLKIGTGQPDTTGYVMAIYGILIPYLGNTVRVTPDFDEQIFEGRLKAKGHICIFTLLRHALSVLFDKNLRIVYKRFKKHKVKVATESGPPA